MFQIHKNSCCKTRIDFPGSLDRMEVWVGETPSSVLFIV